MSFHVRSVRVALQHNAKRADCLRLPNSSGFSPIANHKRRLLPSRLPQQRRKPVHAPLVIADFCSVLSSLYKLRRGRGYGHPSFVPAALSSGHAVSVHNHERIVRALQLAAYLWLCVRHPHLYLHKFARARSSALPSAVGRGCGRGVVRGGHAGGGLKRFDPCLVLDVMWCTMSTNLGPSCCSRFHTATKHCAQSLRRTAPADIITSHGGCCNAYLSDTGSRRSKSELSASTRSPR